MTLDDLSGLPVLPEGQFWRLERYMGVLILKRMTKVTAVIVRGFRKQPVEYEKAIGREILVIGSTRTQLIEEALLAAEKIMASVDLVSAISDLEGDYPPKRLEVSGD